MNVNYDFTFESSAAGRNRELDNFLSFLVVLRSAVAELDYVTRP